jgi:hypothetical protein
MGGIARYNQSIVSGMLSMGQPMAGQPPAVPFGKQPIEPELQPAAQQDNLMSAEAGDNPSGSGSGRKKVLSNGIFLTPIVGRERETPLLLTSVCNGRGDERCNAEICIAMCAE